MSTPFILRPIATTLMIVAVMLLGLIGLGALPMAALPTVDFPTIQVTTAYPGASPEVVATAVTAPLEHAFGQISGLVNSSSTSAAGISQIALQFALNRKIDAAAQDVQAAINAASGWLPLDLLPGPPTYRLVNPADTPVLVLALTSQTLPLIEVNDYAKTVILPKLSQVSGVGAVTIEGGQSRAVRLQVDPARLAALGLSLEDVRRAVEASTVNNPKGALDGPRQAFQIGANDQLQTAEAYRDVVIAYRRGAPVKLGDVGRAVDGVENAELAGWYNGNAAVVLNIQRQPGANTIDVVDAIKALLPRLKSVLPPALKFSIVTDRTVTIRAAIADVEATLLITVGLVVLVILVFLRRLWATVIPSVTLPVSLIATFGGMALMDFSLDNLSLMALTIATGFVVDDAIVMIENIARYVEAGEPPLAAALKGARQIGFTIVSLTVSLVAVFIPLLLMGGVVGRLFREFALTLSLAVVISGVVSLTLTPMMCARLLQREPPSHKPPRFFIWCEQAFELIARGYARGLDVVLAHRGATLLFTLATVAATAWLALAVPKGFLPEQDTGILIGITDGPQDISFAAMSERQRAIADLIGADPAVISVGSFVGIGVINPTLNTGRLFIDIGPPGNRPDAQSIMRRLQTAAEAVPGITLNLQAAQDLAISTRVSRTQYQYVLQALDPSDLAAGAKRLMREMRAEPVLADVASDQQEEGLQLVVTVDRKSAARSGLSMTAIDQTLYDAFGQRQIATVYSPVTQYRVLLEVDPAMAADPGILGKIYLTASGPAATGSAQQGNDIGAAFGRAFAPVPLAAVATLARRPSALLVTHQGLLPAITLSFNLAPGASLGAGLAALGRAEARAGLPETITRSLAGTAAEFAASLSAEGPLILAAIVTVYIVLGVLYESFIHPITILSTLPSAGVGALIALIGCGKQLDLVSLIGIVLLIGIVKKNAIMMVDFALAAEREEGLAAEAAIRQAAIQRFRPIMMTTMAALFGALPLAIGTGTGSELRAPLGIAIVGGLITSQVLTLYTTPVIYLAFNRLRRRLQRTPVRTAPAASVGEGEG